MSITKRLASLISIREFRLACNLQIEEIAKNNSKPNRNALHILFACSHWCIAEINQPNNNVIPSEMFKDFNDLISLCKCEDLRGDELLKYCQIVFYIIKYYLHFESFSELLCIKDIILPEFVTELSQEEKSRSCYKSCCVLLIQGVADGLVANKLYSPVIDGLMDLSAKLIMCIDQDSSLLRLNVFLNKKLNANMLHKLHYGILNAAIMYSEAGSAQIIVIKTLNAYLQELLRNERQCVIVFPQTLKVIKVLVNEIEYMRCDLLLNRFLDVLKAFQLKRYLMRSLSRLRDCLDKHCNSPSPFIHEIICLVATCFTIQIQRLNALPKHEWQSVFSAEIQQSLISLVESLSIYAQIGTITCCCQNINDLNTALNTRLTAAKVCMSFITHWNSENFSETSILQKCYLANFYRIIECCGILREVKCKKFEYFWRNTAYIMHAICVNSNERKLDICEDYLKLLLKAIYKFDREFVTLEVLTGLFSILSRQYLTFERHTYALAWQAYILRLSIDNTKLWHTWTWLKSQTDIKKTVIEILDDNKLLYEEINPNYNPTMSIDETLKLLHLELDAYVNQWKSGTSILAVYQYLAKLGKYDILIREIANYGIEIGVSLHQSFLEIIESCLHYIKECLKYDQIKLIVGGAFLNCICYFIKLRDQKEIIKKELKLAPIVRERTLLPHETADPNDTCDASNVLLLRIENHVKNFEYINKALNCVQQATHHKDFNAGIANEFKMYDLIKNLAHLFELHCYLDKSQMLWKLALKIARILDNKLYCLEANGFILSRSSSYDITELKDNYLSLENESTEPNDLLTIFNYYLNVCFGYLRNADYVNALVIYEKAVEVFYLLDKPSEETDESLDFTVAKAKYFHLQSCIMTLPCSFRVENHETRGLIKSYLAYKTSAEFMRHKDCQLKWTLSYLLIVCFDISEYVVDLYIWLNQPREVRCYGKDRLDVAQLLLIPYRMCRILIPLARADIISGKYDDCKCKLNSLMDILCLGTIKQNKLTPSKLALPSSSKIGFGDAKYSCDLNPNEISELAYGIQEICLDTRESRKEARDGSPVFKQTFQIPMSVYHENTCNCMHCSCPEIKTLMLQKLFLDALLNDNCNESMADRCYLAAINISTELKSAYFKWASPNFKFICICASSAFFKPFFSCCPEIKSLILQKLHLDALLNDNCNESMADRCYIAAINICTELKSRNYKIAISLYHHILLDYIRNLYSKNMIITAKTYLEEIYDYYNKNPIKNFHLYTDVVCIRQILSIDIDAHIKKFAVSDTIKSNRMKNVAEATTPEHNIQRIAFPKTVSPTVQDPNALKRKPTFAAKNLFDDFKTPKSTARKKDTPFKIYATETPTKRTTRNRRMIEFEAELTTSTLIQAGSSKSNKDQFKIPTRKVDQETNKTKPVIKTTRKATSTKLKTTKSLRHAHQIDFNKTLQKNTCRIRVISPSDDSSDDTVSNTKNK